ncbi:DNA-processing protein DprA [Actinomycetaceae bacterium L2_0104]
MVETDSARRLAAMAWTRLAEGEDVYATRLVDDLGYEKALDWLKEIQAGAPVRGEMRVQAERWAGRLDSGAFERDARLASRLGGFLMPGDRNWPESLMDLDDKRPLGLWYHGDPEVLRRLSVSIVGSRDATQYGKRIATDFAYELAEAGVAVVSGGAFGIDTAAHRGALSAGSQTVVVLAGGVDRPYPKQNAGLFGEILAAGGVLVSESPPGAQPLRHRFLSRNRIIAALGLATIVVEAPYRSGAISTARHALEIGRDVGAVPGPVSSPRSAGCHRLLRESAICVTSSNDVAELLGFDIIEAATREGSKRGTQASRQLTLELDDPLAGHPLAVRIRDALPVHSPCTVQKIAATAGVSVAEAIRGLGLLEMEGIAQNLREGWRLAARARR